jgi:hypothetical protein
MEGDAYQCAALSGTIQELGVMPVKLTEAGIPVYQTVMRDWILFSHTLFRGVEIYNLRKLNASH